MDVVDLVALISFVSEIIRSHTSYFPTKPSLVISTNLKYTNFGVSITCSRQIMGLKPGLGEREWSSHPGKVLKLELNTRTNHLQNERTAGRMPIRNSTSTI